MSPSIRVALPTDSSLSIGKGGRREKMEMEIKELEERVIVPDIPTDPHVQWLSNLDQVIPRMRVMNGFYYPGPHAAKLVDADHLATSLSKTLTLYPVLAGRFRKKENGVEGALEVDCNDAGALLVMAMANGRLDETTAGSISCDPLPLSLPIDLAWTSSALAATAARRGDGVGRDVNRADFILAVKVTTFRCGGVSIVLAYHHPIADGLAMAEFMNSWAEIARRGRGIESSPSENGGCLSKSPAKVTLPPVHHRSLLKARVPPRVQRPPASLILAKPSTTPPSPNSLTVTVRPGGSEGGLQSGPKAEAVRPVLKQVPSEPAHPDMSFHLRHFTDEELAALKRRAEEDIKAIIQFEASPRGAGDGGDGGRDPGAEGGTRVDPNWNFPIDPPAERLSTNDVLMAHLWKCVTRARGLHLSKAEEKGQHEGEGCTDVSRSCSDTSQSGEEGGKLVRLGMAVDCRKRLQPRLPEGYFGNAICWSTATSTAGQLVTESLGRTARRIRRSVQEMGDDTLRDTVDWIEQQEVVTAIKLSSRFQPGQGLVCSNWSHFPFWGSDFGWGPPLVSGFAPSFEFYDGMIVINGSGKTKQASGYGGGGLLVTVFLPTDQMNNLKSDPHFIKPPVHAIS